MVKATTTRESSAQQVLGTLATRYQRLRAVQGLRLYTVRVLLAGYADLGRSIATATGREARKAQVRAYFKRLCIARARSLPRHQRWQVDLIRWLASQESFLGFVAQRHR